MRYGDGNNEFDTSDVFEEIDCLDDVLDVAVDVMRDYAPEPGRTRIERMARFLALQLGGEPYGATDFLGAIARFECGPVSVCRVGDNLAVVGNSKQEGLEAAVIHLDAIQARELAIALLRAAELVDGQDTEPTE